MTDVPRSSWVLAEEWQRTGPGLFGRYRLLLSLLGRDEDIVLHLLVFPSPPNHRVEWGCSPPGHAEGQDFEEGAVRADSFEHLDQAIMDAKGLALAAWQRWIAEELMCPICHRPNIVPAPCTACWGALAPSERVVWIFELRRKPVTLAKVLHRDPVRFSPESARAYVAWLEQRLADLESP